MRIGRILLAAATAAVLAACSTTHAPKGGSDQPPSTLPPSETPHPVTEEGSVPRVEKPARGPNRPYTVLGKSYTPVTGDKPMRQVGTGSWYGKQFHGKKTSNGEIFNMYAVSAAHKTMEIPSYARVTNLENGKTIIVRVNDRGPFVGTRIIDLSYEAARRLGYAVKGTARVEVERITMAEIASGSWNRGTLVSSTIPAASADAGQTAASQRITRETRGSLWSVQVGAFSSADNARAWSAHTQAMLSSANSGRPMPTRIVRSSDGLYRVLVGSGMRHEAASGEAARIASITGAPAFAAQR